MKTYQMAMTWIFLTLANKSIISFICSFDDLYVPLKFLNLYLSLSFIILKQKFEYIHHTDMEDLLLYFADVSANKFRIYYERLAVRTEATEMGWDQMNV